MAANLTFDDLRLFQAAFEVRFDEALLLWDRAGTLWERTLKAMPDLKRQHVEPNKTVFARLAKPQIELTVELMRLGVIEHDADKKPERFSDVVSTFSDIVSSTLGIVQYQRVGLRLMFEKEFATPESAAEAMLSTGMLKTSQSAQFGVSSAILHPEYALRREDGKNGFSVRLKAETAKLEITLPLGWSDLPDISSRTKHRMTLDVDCYIQAPVPVETMRFVDWISQMYHIIRRDGATLIG